MICVLIARLNRKHRIIFISVLTILSSFGANFNPTGTNFDITKFSLGSVHYLSAAGMRGGGWLTNGKTQCKKVFVPLYHVGKLSLRTLFGSVRNFASLPPLPLPTHCLIITLNHKGNRHHLRMKQSLIIILT